MATDGETEDCADIRRGKYATIPERIENRFPRELARPNPDDSLLPERITVNVLLKSVEVIARTTVVNIATSNDSKSIAALQGIKDVASGLLAAHHTNRSRISRCGGPLAAAPHRVNFSKSLYLRIVVQGPIDAHRCASGMMRDGDGPLATRNRQHLRQFSVSWVGRSHTRGTVARKVEIAMSDGVVRPFLSQQGDKSTAWVVAAIGNIDKVFPLRVGKELRMIAQRIDVEKRFLASKAVELFGTTYRIAKNTVAVEISPVESLREWLLANLNRIARRAYSGGWIQNIKSLNAGL
jgi:hypothetical protein